MTLLVLEDCVDTRQMVVESVKMRGLSNEIYTATTIEEAQAKIEEHDIDIFIVDLSLPDGSGYDFINYIRVFEQYLLSWVVIITGTTETIEEVIDAYNNSMCHRYIRKPFSMAYLCDTLEELKNKKVVPVDDDTKLMIKRKSVDYFFEYDEIVYVETVDKTAYLYTKDKKHAIGRMTLNELEERLPDNQFLRVHRSFIVNKKYIDYITRTNNQSLIKIKHYDHQIPIGRTYKEYMNMY